MPELSRVQIAVYGALAVVALLLGARWIQANQAEPAAAQTSSYSSASPASAIGADSGAGAVTDSTTADSSFESGAGGAVVHVAGAVKNPGVYRLPGDSRVIDAVKRAGGATGDASLDSINLAAKLADGQQVVVPAKLGSASDATSDDAAATGDAASAAASSGPISLGTATVDQLDTIDGIGPVTAQDIIDFRDQHGGISSIDELDQVSGIGPATMAALRDRLQP